MAIFHMSFSNISAGKGRSAIASAAYRSGEKLFDQYIGTPKLVSKLYQQVKNDFSLIRSGIFFCAKD